MQENDFVKIPKFLLSNTCQKSPDFKVIAMSIQVKNVSIKLK